MTMQSSAAPRDPLRTLFESESGPTGESATIRESVRRRLFGGPAPAPARIGRYRIDGVLGSGGMGTVFLGYDARLGRQIAVKLLHEPERPQSRERRRIRLFREAQGLARLSHPNVVGVYDVDVHEDQLFLVMDYAPGVTLKQWLEERPRSWQEIALVMRQAGEGLAAAHEAGLVHRDLKPSNILVGQDGRARLIDFGLVRFDDLSTSSSERAETLEATASGRDGPALGADITATGAVIGTLAYIAPEVFTGAPADFRSDIYSFCVTLYEALHGLRPFHAENRDALILRIVEGRLQPAPKTQAPAWLVRLCLQGLATDPAKRPASMAALVAELGRHRRRTPWYIGAAAAVGLLVGGAGAALALPGVEVDACANLDSAALWQGEARERARAAFAAATLPFVEHAWPEVDAALAAHSEALASASRRACGDEPVARVRQGCVAAAATTTASLIGDLGRGDPAALELALERALTLPDPSLCFVGELTRDPSAVAALGGALDTRLRHAASLADDGRHDLALAELAALQPVAEAAGATGHLADLWMLRARIELQQDAPGAATSAAVAESLALRAAPRRAGASALATRLATLASLPGDDPTPWIHLARTQLRDGSLTPLERADVHAGLADLATARGDLTAARAHRLAVRDLRLRYLPADHPRVAAAWNDLGAAHDRLGERPLARAAYERALAIRERALRPGHPAIGFTLTNLAGLQAAEGDLDGARVTYERALEITRGALGDAHPRVATVLHDLGVLARQSGDLDGALARYAEALAIRRAAYRGDHPLIAATLNAMAVAHKRRGDLDLAAAEYRDALAIRERILGPAHLDVASTAGSLASLLVDRGENDEALALLDRAHAIYRDAGATGDPDRAWILRLRGAARLSRGERDAAITDLREAVLLDEATQDRDPSQASELARARLLLARAEGRGVDARPL